MKYRSINKSTELKAFTEMLKREGRTTIALDFEGEFNLHVYGEKLCLIQIHDGVEPVIIDPLLANMGAVRELLEDEKILKIMWDASSDISLIVNGYDMTIKSVLDLRPAADLLTFPKRDYSSMLGTVLGVETKNKSRFQRYNWLKRPIDSEAVLYALDDVLYLHALKDALLKRIYDEGHLEEFLRQNLIVQNRNYLREPGQRHKKMKGYRYLNRTEQERLKRIFDLRDSRARELNWPPHRVIPNQELIELARRNLSPDRVSFDRQMDRGVQQRVIEELASEIGRD
jgi:ribonuclease D